MHPPRREEKGCCEKLAPCAQMGVRQGGGSSPKEVLGNNLASFPSLLALNLPSTRPLESHPALSACHPGRPPGSIHQLCQPHFPHTATCTPHRPHRWLLSFHIRSLFSGLQGSSFPSPLSPAPLPPAGPPLTSWCWECLCQTL